MSNMISENTLSNTVQVLLVLAERLSSQFDPERHDGVRLGKIRVKVLT